MSTLSIRLSDAIDEYLLNRKANNLAPNTIRQDRGVLTKLLTTTGNIYVKSLEPRHVDAFVAEQAKTNKPSSLGVMVIHLRGFFSWCRERKYLPLTVDPIGRRRIKRETTARRRQVPQTEFPALLDAAANPEDRLIVALGLYLFLRQSEIKLLKMGNVDLDARLIGITRQKVRTAAVLPICDELAEEIRRWFAHIKAVEGRIEDDWPLVPSRREHAAYNAETGRFDSVLPREVTYVWSRPLGEPHLAVQRALEANGFPVRDGDGGTLREGVHTLRRSGARALYDRLASEGHDGALRRVQTMLGHKSASMTELYLGIDLDHKQVNDLLRGQRMFPVVEEIATVVELSARETGT